MRGGLENRNKTIAASALGVCALGAVIYAYQALFGGGPPPAAAPAPARQAATSQPAPAKPQTATQGPTLAAAPGVAAVKMASTSASLDPTLDETAMLRTESLVYSGSGRNIFSATYVAPVVVVPKNVPPVRTTVQQVVQQPIQPSGPPPPPPINLKFFGTELRAGVRQAFLLAGDDIYLAAQGDIVARKYRIVTIGPSSVQVEDLANSNTQTLPLQN